MVNRVTGELQRRGAVVVGVLNLSPRLAQDAFEGKPLECRAVIDSAREIVASLYRVES